MFSVNVFGPMLATKAALPLFPEGGGSIINIGSVIGEMAPSQASIYAGTKGALTSITRVFAKELAPWKIRVNAVNPGAVQTEGFLAAGFKDSPFKAYMVQNTPLGRLGTPKDIADVVTYLASDDSGWIWDAPPAQAMDSSRGSTVKPTIGNRSGMRITDESLPLL
jgi:3-oxoacyl-[acyl-carrier protein] reductase